MIRYYYYSRHLSQTTEQQCHTQRCTTQSLLLHPEPVRRLSSPTRTGMKKVCLTDTLHQVANATLVSVLKQLSVLTICMSTTSPSCLNTFSPRKPLSVKKNTTPKIPSVTRLHVSAKTLMFMWTKSAHSKPMGAFSATKKHIANATIHRSSSLARLMDFRTKRCPGDKLVGC